MPELKYTKDHECLMVEDDVIRIGITKHAQEALGDLVFVELPEIGKKLNKGDDFAVVESVKTAAEVYTPVAGEVVEVNENMPDNLEMITSPLDQDGWIAKIKLDNNADLDGLMDEAAYKDYLETID